MVFGKLVRMAARQVLLTAGLDMRSTTRRLEHRREKVTLELEHARAEATAVTERLKAVERAAAEAAEAATARLKAVENAAATAAESARVARVARETELRREYVERVRDVERCQKQIKGLVIEHDQRMRDADERATAALEEAESRRLAELASLEERYGKELEEAESRRQAELAAAEQGYSQQLNSLHEKYRSWAATIAHDANAARQSVMMVEVKLDIVEGAITMLDRRSRLNPALAADTITAGQRPSSDV